MTMTKTRTRISITAVVLLLVAAVAATAWLRPHSTTTRATAEIMALDGKLDSGLIYLVTDGTKTRIQQPLGATLQELERDGVTVGTTVSTVEVTDEVTDSAFVVVPPDGPEAHLHLLIDGVLHPVKLNSVSAVSLEALPDSHEPVFDRLRIVS